VPSTAIQWSLRDAASRPPNCGRLPTSCLPARLAALAQHVDCNTLLYSAAALVARFWYEHMWMIYIAMAYATMLGLHQ